MRDAPRQMKTIPSEQELIRRLAARGITLTPANVGPDDPLPEPVDLNGLSLSDAVIEMRPEP